MFKTNKYKSKPSTNIIYIHSSILCSFSLAKVRFELKKAYILCKYIPSARENYHKNIINPPYSSSDIPVWIEK